MGKFYDSIPDGLVDFIQRSKIFFVATAPLEGGSVNVSPKANEGTFEVVNGNRVRYLDLTGSGNETISHLLQRGNGRITLMFANIEQGAPNIVRLFGKGCVRERTLTGDDFDQRWQEQRQTDVPIGARAIIDVAVHTCSTSCGYSLPVYAFQRKRTVLDDFHSRYAEKGIEAMMAYKKSSIPIDAPIATSKGEADNENETAVVSTRPIKSALEAYWAICNTLSIDGLPGMESVRGLLDEKEQIKLQEQARQNDALKAPPPDDDLGPLKQNEESKGPAPASLQQAQRTNGEPLHLLLAFAAGCTLTAAVLLSTR